MTRDIRVGVVGCGYWGPKLIRNFVNHLGASMCAVADRDPRRVESVQSSYPHLEGFSSAQAMLADAELDAVAIATPVHTHYEIAQQAIKMGKHVLIEKPMTHSVDSSRKLIGLARRNDIVLMVDHTFIYTGAVRKMKEYIERDELGDLYYFDSVRVNLGMFQHDVNVIWDLAPHDISIMEYLISSVPYAVSAHGAAHVDFSSEPIENIAYITVFYPDNLIAHVHVNWLAPVKVRKTLVSGSEKMLVYDDTEADEKVKVYDTGIEIEPTTERERVYETLVSYRTGSMHAPKLDRTEALQVETQHFLDCIEKGGTPITDGDSGFNVVQILEAAQRSMDRSGEIVYLEAGAAEQTESI